MNKHVNKVRKATGRAEAITAGRQQNKQQYCDVPTTLLLFSCVFAYVNDKFTYFFVCALLFGFLMIEPLLR